MLRGGILDIKAASNLGAFLWRFAQTCLKTFCTLLYIKSDLMIEPHYPPGPLKLPLEYRDPRSDLALLP
jgi:hypothetical protein